MNIQDYVENLDQENREAEAIAAYERRLEGQTDAAFSFCPRYADDEYMAGYCQGLKSRETNEYGEILWKVH